jgi:hypothetical protein
MLCEAGSRSARTLIGPCSPDGGAKSSVALRAGGNIPCPDGSEGGWFDCGAEGIAGALDTGRDSGINDPLGTPLGAPIRDSTIRSTA